jgi:hypothetical protein
MSKKKVIRKNEVREIVVSFQPSRVGSFHAVLDITFSDKGPAGYGKFTVTRELRGRAILPGGFAVNEDVEDAEEVGGTGITVSHESGLEFFVERSDVLFPKQTRELVITETSAIPVVSFKDAKVYSLDDSVAR